MVSFLNANLPVLMQLSRAEGGTLLPWPNGSVLSGRLTPPTEGTGAMLMLGNYRVRVEVPPNTPMSQVWLQVLQRELPGQFRLLTDKQAAVLIVEMLKQQQTKPEVSKNIAQEQGQAKQSAHQSANQPINQQQEWGKLPSDVLPFDAQSYGERLMLLNQQDGSAQGLLQKEEGKDGFMLSGRLDLDNLGALAFSLEGQAAGNTWKVHIHLENGNLKHDVEQAFATWLEQHQTSRLPTLAGAVFDVIPENLGSASTRSG